MDQFADLALAKLLTAAPQLGAAVLNFQDVTDQIDDTGVQVGLFVLRTNLGGAYVPVVAKDETIFPLDSIFLEDEGRFIPLTKTTINRLLMAAPTQTGKPNNLPKGVPRNPDITPLMNPPRTGKYVYSSASRLTEFLAACPPRIQAFVMEKLAGEQSAYSALDQMFGLKAIFAALKGSVGPSSEAGNSIEVGPAAVGPAWSVITSPRDIKAMADEAMANQFMRDGYVLSPGSGFSRVAVQYQPYNSDGTVRQVTPAVDGGMEYNVLFKDGTQLAAYLPSYHRDSPTNDVVLFGDGSYARGPVMAIGDDMPKLGVLSDLFTAVPPKLLRDCYNDDNIMLFFSDGSVMGPFRVYSVIMDNIGVTLKVGGGSGIDMIIGSKNLRTESEFIGKTLYVQHNVIVLPLGENRSYDLETSGNSAIDKRQLMTSQFLGASLDLRYDGISFTKDKMYLGEKVAAFKHLVEEEYIDPAAAQNFLKQAEEIKHVKIFLSKKADMNTAGADVTEIPTYGDLADNQEDQVNKAGIFTGALNDAVDVGDPQVMEATIISQLLQQPDLFEMIQEYLPELQAATDKLGRTLLLSRVKIDQLAEAMDSDNVFALISKIKTTYKTLGDTVCRLEETANVSSGFDRNTAAPKANGV